MCGIGGVMMFPRQRTSGEIGYIKNLVSIIATESSRRGMDATGLVTFNKKETKVFKAPQAAKKFVSTMTYKMFTDANIDHDTQNILIHTRAGTKGSEINNDNNHPIESRKFVGVHNGMIYNDDELFKSEKLFRLAQVDSEVIFRLHDKYGCTMDGVRQAAEKLQGAFTYAFASRVNGNLLYLVRNNNPVVLAYVPSLNIIIFASEKRFLQTAIDEANSAIGFDLINDASCKWVEPKGRTIMVFDTNLDTAIDQIHQEGSSFTPSTSYTTYWDSSYEDGWYNDEYFGWKARYAKNNKKDIEEDDNEALEEDIMAALDSELSERLVEFIQKVKDDSWNQGWSDGRSSLDDEMRHSRSLAFEQGREFGRGEGLKIKGNTEIVVQTSV